MHRFIRRVLPALGLALLGSTAHAQFNVYGITGGTGPQRLVRFDSNNPGAVTVIGNTGVNLIGIDFRPATGMLYGYNGSLLYIVNLATGAAVQASDIVDVTNTNAGIDFNPTVDRLRIVDQNGLNLRVDVDAGTTITDGTVTYTLGGATGGVTGLAYSNNDTDPATGTTLYGIDSRLGDLVMFTNPNAGAVSRVGSLGLPFLPVINGFDIVTTGGTNVAYLAALGTMISTASSFYSVNLTSGEASLIGSIGGGSGLQGIAVQVAVVPEPGTFALFAVGFALVGGVVRRRRAPKLTR